MSKETLKRKTDLLRNARAQLRDWSALFDSLRAIGDPHAAKVVAEQLACQHNHLTETVNLLGEMTQKVCTATLTLDLDTAVATNGAE